MDIQQGLLKQNDDLGKQNRELIDNNKRLEKMVEERDGWIREYENSFYGVFNKVEYVSNSESQERLKKLFGKVTGRMDGEVGLDDLEEEQNWIIQVEKHYIEEQQEQ